MKYIEVTFKKERNYNGGKFNRPYNFHTVSIINDEFVLDTKKVHHNYVRLSWDLSLDYNLITTAILKIKNLNNVTIDSVALNESRALEK